MPGLEAIWRKLRREGLRGIHARLRHPRAPQFAMGGVRPTELPLKLSGGFAELEQALEVGPLKACFAEEGGLLAVDPLPAECIPQPVACLFTCAQTLAAFLSLDRAIGAGQMLLVPDAASLELTRAAGYQNAQMMLVPVGTGPAALAAGLLRWLVAAGVIEPASLSPDLFPELADLRPGARLCLSLPEAIGRRADFASLELPGFSFFSGLRLSAGWQGAAESYALLARSALSRGAVPLTICEDDMQPGPDFQARLGAIETALSERDDWDVFSGLISDLAEGARVSGLDTLPGQKLVDLDTTMGMVFNIFGRRALQRLAEWQPGRGEARSNTIDVWLSQMPGLRVVTSLPFLAGHNSRQRSTISGFSNQRYDGLIAGSTARLERLVAEFEARQSSQ